MTLSQLLFQFKIQSCANYACLASTTQRILNMNFVMVRTWARKREKSYLYLLKRLLAALANSYVNEIHQMILMGGHLVWSQYYSKIRFWSSTKLCIQLVNDLVSTSTGINTYRKHFRCLSLFPMNPKIIERIHSASSSWYLKKAANRCLFSVFRDKKKSTNLHTLFLMFPHFCFIK